MRFLRSNHHPSQEDRYLHRRLHLRRHLKFERAVSLHVVRGIKLRMAIFKLEPIENDENWIGSNNPNIQINLIFKYHNSMLFRFEKTYHHRHRLQRLHLCNLRLFVIREIRKGNKFRFGFRHFWNLKFCW